MNGLIRRFAGFEYSPQSGLRKDGTQIHLGPQARQLLELLLESEGGVVSKADIAARLWPDRPPSDDSIDRCAYLLRKPLREAGYGDLIATAYGRGLSLRAKVEVVESGAAAPGDGAQTTQLLDLLQTVYELVAAGTRDSYARAHSAVAAASERGAVSPTVWSLSADVAAARAIRGYLPSREAAGMIEADAGRSLAQAPDFPAALAVLGWARAALSPGAGADGLALLDQAVARAPAYGKARAYRAWALARLDRLPEAIHDAEEGLAASPYNQALLSLVAWLHLCCGDIDKSARLVEEGLRMRPDGGWLHLAAAVVASVTGRHQEAEEAVRRGLEAVPGDPAMLLTLAAVLAASGRKDEAELSLASAAPDGAAPLCLFAAPALLALGREDDATAVLTRGRDEGCPWFAFVHRDPRLFPLRDRIARLREAAPADG